LIELLGVGAVMPSFTLSSFSRGEVSDRRVRVRSQVERTAEASRRGNLDGFVGRLHRAEKNESKYRQSSSRDEVLDLHSIQVFASDIHRMPEGAIAKTFGVRLGCSATRALGERKRTNMSRKRFFRFSYLTGQRGDRRIYPHQLRDGDACIELTPILMSLGYEYGGGLLNYEPGTPDLSKELRNSLGPSDLLVLTTRPPLDDKPYKDKKKVIPSRYWFEREVIFGALKPAFFTFCSRLEVDVSENVSEALLDEFKNRAILCFHIDAEASYASSSPHKKWALRENS
jgi:hypothetical protein